MNISNPAPWVYENVEDRSDRSAHGVVKDANGVILFDTLNADSRATEIMREDDGEGGVNYYDLQAEANLTLAAAAPELREALENLWLWQTTVQELPPDGLADFVRAVLAKSERTKY